MNHARLSLALAGLVMAGCGGGDEHFVLVYTALGSVQCEGGGQSLPVIQSVLQGAGVEVISASCGLDGLARPALCGAPDGRIAIFEILQSQSQLASSAGFGHLAGMPFVRTPCV